MNNELSNEYGSVIEQADPNYAWPKEEKLNVEPVQEVKKLSETEKYRDEIIESLQNVANKALSYIKIDLDRKVLPLNDPRPGHAPSSKDFPFKDLIDIVGFVQVQLQEMVDINDVEGLHGINEEFKELISDINKGENLQLKEFKGLIINLDTIINRLLRSAGDRFDLKKLSEAVSK